MMTLDEAIELEKGTRYLDPFHRASLIQVACNRHIVEALAKLRTAEPAKIASPIVAK